MPETQFKKKLQAFFLSFFVLFPLNLACIGCKKKKKKRKNEHCSVSVLCRIAACAEVAVSKS